MATWPWHDKDGNPRGPTGPELTAWGKKGQKISGNKITLGMLITTKVIIDWMRLFPGIWPKVTWAYGGVYFKLVKFFSRPGTPAELAKFKAFTSDQSAGIHRLPDALGRAIDFVIDDRIAPPHSSKFYPMVQAALKAGLKIDPAMTAKLTEDYRLSVYFEKLTGIRAALVDSGGDITVEVRSFQNTTHHGTGPFTAELRIKRGTHLRALGNVKAIKEHFKTLVTIKGREYREVFLRVWQTGSGPRQLEASVTADMAHPRPYLAEHSGEAAEFVNQLLCPSQIMDTPKQRKIEEVKRYLNIVRHKAVGGQTGSYFTNSREDEAVGCFLLIGGVLFIMNPAGEIYPALVQQEKNLEPAVEGRVFMPPHFPWSPNSYRITLDNARQTGPENIKKILPSMLEEQLQEWDMWKWDEDATETGRTHRAENDKINRAMVNKLRRSLHRRALELFKPKGC